MNASFEVGLKILGSHAKRALGACIPPDRFLNAAGHDREKLLAEFGASPHHTPDHDQENPFEQSVVTPAVGLVQNPFDHMEFHTPALEVNNPFEQAKQRAANLAERAVPKGHSKLAAGVSANEV